MYKSQLPKLPGIFGDGLIIVVIVIVIVVKLVHSTDIRLVYVTKKINGSGTQMKHMTSLFPLSSPTHGVKVWHVNFQI